MLLQIPDVLTPDQVLQCRQKLDQAEWIDGKITAGYSQLGPKTTCSFRKVTRWLKTWVTQF